MAVYFSHPVQPVPGHTEDVVYTGVEWHDNGGLLAVASKNGTSDADGTVCVHHDEGELVEDSLIQRSAVVQCLSWHTDKQVLAIGWRSGEVTVYRLRDSKMMEYSCHRAPITLLRWGGTGTRLVTADRSGLLVIWRADSSGQLNSTPLTQHRIKATPTHCVILTRDDEGEEEIRLLVAADGWLYLIAEGEDVQKHHRVAHSLHSLLLSSEKHLLVCISQDMFLTVFSLSDLGVESKVSEAKLGGVMVTDVIWAPHGVLATCSEEPVIRFWDCEGGENYVLPIKETTLHGSSEEEDLVTTIAYSATSRQLAAGTNMGNVVIWRQSSQKVTDPAQQWEVIAVLHQQSPIMRLTWATKHPLLSVNHDTSVSVLAATNICHHMSKESAAVQVQPKELLVDSVTSPGTPLTISCDMQIRGVSVSKDHAAVWDGKKVSVFVISQSKSFARPAGSFSCDAKVLAVYDQSIVMVQHGQLSVTNFKGQSKQSLALGDENREIVSISVAGTFVAVAASDGNVWLVDLKRREPRLVASTSVSAVIPGFRRLLSAHSNSTGTHVSLLLFMEGTNVLSVWGVEKNTVQLLDVSAVLASEREEIPAAHRYLSLPQDIPRDSYKEQLRQAACLHDNRLAPVSHCWDVSHPNLLPFHAITDTKHTKVQPDNRAAVVTVFLLSDGHILFHNVHPLDHTHTKFIGCSLPRLYFTTKKGDGIDCVAVRGFDDLEGSDESTLTAMLTFFHHSCAGNMDEAFRSIKTIRNSSVWESMARMCVRTHRLDVALLCLGNMGNAKAARAVRHSLSIPEEDARLAVLAVQLGMLDEAEELYLSSGRYDLLNKFYQAAGKWQKAVEVAELHDRVHLKTTYYALAKNSEAVGELQVAINSYEQSNTHQFEVPRMLLEDTLELETYVMRSKDRDVHKWWAEYLESVGDSEGALQYYESAEDYYSMIRVLHYTGHTERAIQLVEETTCKAGAYHLARQLSQESDVNSIKKAIKLFTTAQCYSPAIQLAKEHGLESDLMGLALMGSQVDKIDAAQYYESSSDTQDKAILLYHRGGELAKALELCFQQRQFDVLQQIAEELDEDAGPEVVNMVAGYFTEHQQYDKAVQLLMRTGQLADAVELCITHSVPVNEELADGLTPTKKTNETPAEAEQRLQLLERLADCCALQGAYHLATKKYTQAGNKVKAMQALIKSGDTEKIVFFAGVSRQRDIYVMAANYLQLLNWRDDGEIMKYIITFYTKGKAMDSLASFYDTCAQMEIDKYQNYEKAVNALTEALKCLSKTSSKGAIGAEEKIALLKHRISLVQRFAVIRSGYADSPEESVRQAQALLDEPQLDAAVRVGDVYAVLIEHYTQSGDFKQAMSLMDEMRQRIPGVNMAFYLDRTTIESVYKALAIPLGRGVGEVMPRGMEEEDGGSDGSSVGEEVED